MKVKDYNDTIIASITAIVGGSVSLIRISGDNAISITDKYFTGTDLTKQTGGRFFHGNFINHHGKIIDDVILLLYNSPNSYTGEDVVEISCHGNPFVVEELIQQYLSAGCRMADPGEFSKRAFLNGKMDLLQAEAVADLISAKSKRITENSIALVGGRLSELILKLKEELIKIASLLTLDLDFSEEDLDIIQADQIADSINKARNTLEALIGTYNFGRLLNKGIEVLICGKPNVGKSSILNALINQDRAIVSSTPGTTRDTIHEDVVIENISIRFIDTAGIRITTDHIEAEGVLRSEAAFNKADIILLIIDISEGITEEDQNLINKINASYKNRSIIIGNKKDKSIELLTKKEIYQTGIPVLEVSAKTGNGIIELQKSIINMVKVNTNELNEDILITNKRQYEILKKTLESLDHALDSIKNNFGYEFISVDMKTAIDLLSEITGEISTDDILNNIFSNFCIGK
ncbi:MAG: tRNA uridine-5-carboxymethylaminomethyl(34) synthesis GTPase MnmE [Calditrichaceae bacterium]